MRLARSIFVVSIAAFVLSRSATAQTPLTSILIANGFDRPVFAGAPREDYTRLFVVEITGRIKIVENGTVLATPFIDLSTTIQQGSFEGLFGLAFHPDFANNGYFYVYYDAPPQSRVILERYQVSGANPNVADPMSGSVILDLVVPDVGHHGGTIAFGPNDGFLYLALGDSEPQNDVNCNGQNDQLLLSKMIRLDVDGGTPYAIPSTNPFVGDPNVLDEIWSTGLRHPWRFSFDRLTGDMYVGDNGQELIEEINFEPAGFPGGRNYGWPVMEGTQCFALNSCSPSLPACGAPEYEDPILEYGHSGEQCSVIGGYVYRGCAIPDLQGTYFYGDHCGGSNTNGIFSFRYVNGMVTELQDRTLELRPAGGISITNISSFGEDGLGELYVIDHFGGELFKVVPLTAAADCDSDGISDSCALAEGLSQDCNTNGVPDDCDLGSGTSQDCDENGVPDECETPTSIFCNCTSATSFCFGDGGDQMGCTDCPCNNNAPQGTIGGCLNAAGTSSRMIVMGSCSIAAADLRIEGRGVPPLASVQLGSANAAAPANAANPCFGLNSGLQSNFLDGLRCVVQQAERHGVRPADANGDVGVTTNGWGTPDGFFNFAAFVTGSTKHFQLTNREEASAGCMTGLNTSQAVSITFEP